MENSLPNGDFKAEITLSGGTGRTTIQSPADIHIENGRITAELIWSSPNYDFMEIGGVGYTPISNDGSSVFSVVIPALDTELPIKAETVAMSSPHMIEYTLYVSGAEIKLPEEINTSSDFESAISSTQTPSEVTWTENLVTFDFPVIAATVGGAFVAIVIAAVIVQLIKRKKK